MKVKKSWIVFISIVLVWLCQSPVYGAKAKKVDPAEVLEKAKNAFFQYDFDEALELFEEYETLQTKAKKPLVEDFEDWQRRLNIATNAFGRVQKIVVIDSINIPRQNFFNAYKLSSSAGRIGRDLSFKLVPGVNSKEVGFISEDGDYAIIPVADQEGLLQLKENFRLLDNSWETHELFDGDFEKDGDYAYPFMSGDGQTLYFANNGEESMGGLDLFVAQREPVTGETRQPLNLGMPFNSPYDDFMLAIDEERGIGWWATDRNSPGGDVTVYVYLLEEIRQNYTSDTEDLESKAKISDFKSTWQPGKERDYQEILKKIK
ncbi:MAG: hypothetical protein J1D77_03925 [Muribaculaceae bacterium]|nr:hypothetical protein [Muribaculaceae bacterium]